MTMMVLDIETTYKEVNGKTNPSPFITGNKLVSVGVINFDSKGDKIDYFKFFHSSGDESQENFKKLNAYLQNTQLLIGHNIKFDLQWLLECGFKYNGNLYDTMVIDYLLSGGIKCDLTLDGCCRRRNVELPKKDLVSEYIDKGIGFDKISWDTLKEYGIADIKATKCLADYQLDILKTTYKEFI